MPKKDDNKSSRIITLDFMRGYFMIAIILNHLQWYPSGLDWVAMRGSLFVSAAEGFFLLSGVVLGMVRGRKLLDKPFKFAAMLLLKRGSLLYVTSALMTLIFMMVGWAFFMENPGLKPGIRPPDQPFGEVVLGILSFNYIYGWADFLRLYAIFLIASPIALWLIRRGKWYIVTIISITVWSTFPHISANSDHSAELLMVLSWQIIFFAGLVIGFYWKRIIDWWHSLPKKVTRPAYATLIIAGVVSLIANIVLEFSPFLPNGLQSWYTSLDNVFFKEQLSIYRLGLFGLWFMLGFYVFKHYEQFFTRYLGWLLIPFGQNSLYVYILHAFLIFFAHTLIMPPNTGGFWLLSGILSLAVIGIIYLAVRSKFLFKIIPR